MGKTLFGPRREANTLGRIKLPARYSRTKSLFIPPLFHAHDVTYLLDDFQEL